jgi:hypothetical protein
VRHDDGELLRMGRSAIDEYCCQGKDVVATPWPVAAVLMAVIP